MAIPAFFDIGSPEAQARFEGLGTGAFVNIYNSVVTAYNAGPTVKKFENKTVATRRLLQKCADLDLVILDKPGDFGLAWKLGRRPENPAPLPEPPPSQLPAPRPVDLTNARLLARYAPNEEKLPRGGSKAQVLFQLMIRPEGMTDEEGSKAVGWNGCNITAARTCQRAGYDVYSRREDGRGQVYFARRITLISEG